MDVLEVVFVVDSGVKDEVVEEEGHVVMDDMVAATVAGGKAEKCRAVAW